MNVSSDSLKYAGFELAAGLVNELRHRRSNQRARVALKGVESQRGQTPKSIVGQCNDYAQDVLGSRKYAPWLYVYAAVGGCFKEGWIPDNYYGLVVYPMKNKVATKVTILKTFTNRILNTEALPDLAYVIDGVYYSRDFRPIDHAELVATVFEHEDITYFKADDSNQGRSIDILARKGLQEGARATMPDGVFQAPIRQHAFFETLTPKATATIRITTARELDGTIAVKAAYLRLGRTIDDIVRSASAVKVPLDRHTGALANTGYLPDWRSVEAHPDTGVTFSGLSVPKFEDAIELCRSLHAGCPHMPCIGWDVCPDQAGKVKIMEWNAYHNDIKFSEATTGPCFHGLGWETLWRRAKPS